MHTVLLLHDCSHVRLVDTYPARLISRTSKPSLPGRIMSLKTRQATASRVLDYVYLLELWFIWKVYMTLYCMT